MKNKRKIFNKHFWISLFIFSSVLLLVFAFTGFLEEAKTKDKDLTKNRVVKIDNNMKNNYK